MSKDDTTPISAYMITFNNERTVDMALRSLHWVDEIVVVDSFSTDGTLEIAQRYASRVEQRAWPGFRDQYQYASDLCTHDWALFIDADEEISPALAEEMRLELATNMEREPLNQVRGYHAPRRTYYLGRWHLHGGWVPDSEIRLYNRKYGSWKGGLHANVHVDGAVEHFDHFYYHYTYEDLSDQLDTMDRYSTSSVEDMLESGRSWSLRRMLLSPPARFVRDYVLKRGFLDGLPGLIVAVNTMYYSFLKYAKLWEARRDDPPFGDRDKLP